ncbi:MAG: cytidylate kinase family protein [Desulfobacterales bacterium]
MSLITITQRMGCAGEEVAKIVADTLKVELYDDARLQQTAQTMDNKFEDLKSFDEKAPGFFDRLISKKPAMFLDLMEAAIYKVAKKGEGVIIGHGGQFLLRDVDCALHVLIYAQRSTRIEQVAHQAGVSREVAERLIRKSDSNQRGFFQFAFHREWNDLSLFDLVISTEKMAPASAAEIIINATQDQNVKNCSLTALDAMERLSLEKKIEAAILENNFNTLFIHISVPQKGVALVSGLTESMEDRRRLTKIVGAVDGVREVGNEVSIRPTVMG